MSATSRVRSRPLVAFALLGGLAVCGVAGAAPAGAIVTGPCSGTVQGVNVAPLSVSDPSQAIKVKKTDSISYDVSAPSAVVGRSFVLSFAGVDVTVDSGTGNGHNGGSRSDVVSVADYAWMGAGLYQVAGVAHLDGGGQCSGAVLIDVQGDPLGTAAGITGMILTVLGSLGIIASAIRHGGARQVQDIIDLVGLATPENATPEDVIAVLGGAMPAAGSPNAPPPATPAGATAPPAHAEPEQPATDPPAPPPEEPPTRRRRGTVPPVPVSTADPTSNPAGTAPGGNGAVPPTPLMPPTPGGPASTSTQPQPAPAHSGPTPPDAAGAADPATAAAAAVASAAKPPPITGMTTVDAIGSGAKALTEATTELGGHIDSLSISDDQKKKLKETLGVDKIKDKLDTVTSVVETIDHYEAMGTDTVDKMNRWGINANGTNGLLWLKTMTDASSKLGQKYTDGLITPVLEPIAKAAKVVGIKIDAGEVAKTLIPLAEAGQEATKALDTATKNVLGGDNILNQLGQDPVVDDEWRNIRTFN